MENSSHSASTRLFGPQKKTHSFNLQWLVVVVQFLAQHFEDPRNSRKFDFRKCEIVWQAIRASVHQVKNKHG